MAEYWDVYNANRKKTGAVHLRGDPLSPGEYHMVTNVLILNGRGETLLQKRAPNKQMPNLDAAGCRHRFLYDR